MKTKHLIFLSIILSLILPISVNALYCYQEYANVTSSCGGLDTGNYLVTSDGYFYINYTKATRSTNLSLWQVKHGFSTNVSYNISLPQDCWDMNPATVSLRFRSYSNTPTAYSQPYCFNTTGNWKEIGIRESIWGGGTCGSDQSRTLYDGDWTSGTFWTTGLWCSSTTNSAAIWEEAMVWFTNLFLEYNQTYNTNALEGSSQTFTINLSYDDSHYTSFSASLVYNGTSYLGTSSD